MAALLIGTLVAIEFFWQEFAEAEGVNEPRKVARHRARPEWENES